MILNLNDILYSEKQISGCYIRIWGFIYYQQASLFFSQKFYVNRIIQNDISIKRTKKSFNDLILIFEFNVFDRIVIYVLVTEYFC